MKPFNEKVATPHVAVVGGGITGLTAAFYLLRAGYKVTVLEARPQVGGLATYFDFGPFHWDKFYHCILTTDAPLLQLIEDIGLKDEIRWTETKVGFFTNGRLHSMTTSLDFLRFPAISIWEKIRLALGILYTARIQEGLPLEQEPIGPWLTKVFGAGNYQKLWQPLLKCKLGDSSKLVSASFIWATIRRLYSTRDKGASKKERMGYVRGGYYTVFNRLLELITNMGGQVRCMTKIARIKSDSGQGVIIECETGDLHFDYVISTTPSRAFAQLVPDLEPSYKAALERIQYMGMVCCVLLLKRKLTPFYCTNLTDELPFTGIIEMTNLISQDETEGRHLVYLPKYTSPGDPLFEASDEHVRRLFYSSLQKVIPDLQDSEVEKTFVFRERLVQPIPVLNYSALLPPMQTPIPDLWLANTTQIINSTLNNNEMVKIAKEAVQAVFKQEAQTSRLPSKVPVVAEAVGKFPLGVN